MLFSVAASGPLLTLPGAAAPRTLVRGKATGALFGGNLAVIAALCGGPDRLDARGRILLLEDVGEPAYRVDRMLTQLVRAGVLDGVSGLAFGRFTDCPDGEEESVAEVLRETAQRAGVPAVADLPFGHAPHNCTLPICGTALLDADAGTLILEAP
jgi:muramoyltetrapeptide carboxypeptidase